MSKIYKNKRGREVFKIQWNTKNQGTLRVPVPHGVGFTDGSLIKWEIMPDGSLKMIHAEQEK